MQYYRFLSGSPGDVNWRTRYFMTACELHGVLDDFEGVFAVWPFDEDSD